MQIVGQIQGDHGPCWRRINRHIICCVVKKLGTGVPLDVVRVIVAPSQLHIQPELLRRGVVHEVLGVGQKRGLAHVPLVGGEEEYVGTGRVHFVRLTRVDGLLLDGLDLEGVQLLVKDLAQIHDHGLVDLLPEMGAKDLDEGDLESGNLAVHEDAG